MRDDQFLVSDRTENKFYGEFCEPPLIIIIPFILYRDVTWCQQCNQYRRSRWSDGRTQFRIHWPQTTSILLFNIAKRSEFSFIELLFQAATYLCPAIFPWVDTGPATEESGMFVMKMVGVLYLLIFIFDLIIVCGMHNMTTATTLFMFLFLFAIIGVLLAISRKPQNRQIKKKQSKTI